MAHRLSNCLKLQDFVTEHEHENREYFRGRRGFKQMLAYQGGKCAICEEKCVTNKELAIDHCHKTGRIRGLLCMRCNTALGMFRDNPLLLEKAYIYLTTGT